MERVMSEAFDLPKPTIANAAVGAASPLWGYFAGAAMGGVALWWAMKATQPTSYRALLARVPEPAPALPAPAEDAEVPFVPAAEAVSSEPSADVAGAPANDLTMDSKSA